MSGYAEKELLRTHIIQQHLPMAESIAKRFACRGMSTTQLTEAAIAALDEAVSRYESLDSCGFTLYASNCIRQAMVRELANADIGPRIPVRIVEHIICIQKTFTCLERELGRSPTGAELAAEIPNVPTEELEQILKLLP